MPPPLETRRGFVNTWECDEVGHLNVQFYVEAASDAHAYLAAALGLPTGAAADRGHALLPVREHYRFHRELRAADIYVVTTGVSGTGAGELSAYHELRNAASGDIAATINATLAVSESGQSRDALGEGPLARAEALATDVPGEAAPRSVALETPPPQMTLADAEARGLLDIGRGRVIPAQCDAAGRLLPRFAMARFSDGARHLWHQIGMDSERLSAEGRGTVVLESRLDYLHWAEPGDVLIAKSALTEILGKALRFRHFLFEARSGRLLVTSEAIALMLDLEARKAVAFTDGERARLEPHVTAP